MKIKQYEKYLTCSLRRTGFTPKKGNIGQAGLGGTSSCSGKGEITMPPVS